MDIEKFRYGIEHEFPCLDAHNNFVDFSTASFEDLNRVIEELPEYASDYPQLRVGDLGIKKKRWYIEGFERFSDTGAYLVTIIKGFEIRTPICNSISEAVGTLQHNFSQWREAAIVYGYRPATVSFNPFRTAFIPEPALNAWEVAARHSPEEQTAFIHMLTYGPDVSFSHPDLTTEQIISIGKKLTYYSPYIVPFSFSSPFYDGQLWGGLSYRTYYRTGKRPACMVFLENENDLLQTNPTLTDKARIPAEVGRIEFKAFDTVADLDMYGALLALVVGIALDTTLTGSVEVPDASLHQRSATLGFEDDAIYKIAVEVFDAAYNAAPPVLRQHIELLRPMLTLRRVPANTMIDQYKEGRTIIDIITTPHE